MGIDSTHDADEKQPKILDIVPEETRLDPRLDTGLDTGDESPALTPRKDAPELPGVAAVTPGENRSAQVEDGFNQTDGAPGSIALVQGAGDTASNRLQPRASIRLEPKHPLAIRWMHWINFPVLTTMIWSGLLIYWADSDIAYKHPHQVYRIAIGSFTLFRLFPNWFWTWYHAPYRITTGLGYHFFFMWFFALNGLFYVLYTVFSGEWRFLVPTKSSFREAVLVALHDIGFYKGDLPHRKFNGAQQIAYTSVVLMGAGSLVSGLAIYKPAQAHWITTLLGGYEMARWFHFWLTVGYCIFFLIHVSQVMKAGWNNFRAMVSGHEIVPADQAPYIPQR